MRDKVVDTMKRRMILFISVLFLVTTLLPSSASAHSGNTDSRGGHRDHSTGEYHYHHGYSAHQHYDMDGDGKVDCPYDFNDKTVHRSGNYQSGINSFVHIELPTQESFESQDQVVNKDEYAQTKNDNIKVEFSPMKILESLLSMIFALLLCGFSFLIIPIMAAYIISKPCMWIIGMINENIQEEKKVKLSLTISSAIVTIVLYALFLSPATNALIGDPNTLAALLILIGFMLYVFIYHFFAQNSLMDSLYGERNSLHNELSKQKQEYESIIKVLQDKLAHATDESSQMSERFCGTPFVKEIENLKASVNSLTDELAEKNMQISTLKVLLETKKESKTVQSSEDSMQTNISDYLERIQLLEHELESAYSKISESETSRNNTSTDIPMMKVESQIPPEISFAKDGMPVFWKPNPRKPYGDYTVYLNKKTGIYHVDYFCAGYNSTETHIFKVIDIARPCQKCASGYFNFKSVPE